MSLTDNDIIWTLRGLDEVAVIDRCGEYSNVPLIGTQGGITYKPCLALRQFASARRDGPHEMLIQGLIFNYDNNGKVFARDSSELGGC